MEPQIVAVASIVGSLISSILLIDAFRDMLLVKRSGRSELLDVVRKEIRDEVARLILQVLFLIIALAVIFEDRFESFDVGEFALLLLIGVPIVLAIWSILDWIRRLRRDRSSRDSSRRE